ncbi:MAG: hypothetical protein EOO02_04375 [Chitinophagaceae bacterium]|nr:MAG: hypothetical protein EOO02_04375 [Chitinophagaceae bacterium]
MSINRNNYEEYFVLYIDNELNTADRAEVEAFIAANPDLKAELEMFEQVVLPTETPAVFFDKSVLYKSETPATVNETNCEEYFVMYGDNELNNEENALVEEFIYRHPQYQEHFELIQKVRYQPEKHIVFPDKSILYRHERDSRVVPLFPARRIWRMAAAAAVILMIGGTTWYSLQDKAGADNNRTQTVAKNEETKPGSNSQSSSTEKNAVQQDLNTSSGTASVPGDKPAQNSGNDINTNDRIAQPDIAQPNTAQPDVAAANKDVKKSTDTKTDRAINKVVSPQVKPVQDFAQTSKKSQNQSNIQPGSDVTLPKNNDAQNVKVPVVDKPQNIDESMAFAGDQPKNENKVAIGPVELGPNNPFANFVNENEEFEPSDKKNRARGLLRRVSRVFDKATNRQSSDEKKGIHIASFSIPLK